MNVNATAGPIDAFRLELRTAARRRIAARRRRQVVFVAALAVGVLVSGLSIAGTGWLTGEPAPQPVVKNFQAYATQLGFHPEPGKAVFVAADDPVKLYATTNREGAYCLVVDEPWKPASADDGGSCVSKSKAAEPITAWVVGISKASKTGEATFVVAGRVDSAEARTIEFRDTEGDLVRRPIGSSGFYVAAVRGRLPIPVATPDGVRCPANGWKPTLVAVGEDGKIVLSAAVSLMESRRCISSFFGP